MKQAFQITIGGRGAPRLTFGAMADSSCAAHEEYVDLMEPGERMEVRPLNPGEPFPIRVARHQLQEAQLASVLRRLESVDGPSESTPIRTLDGSEQVSAGLPLHLQRF